MNKEGYNAMVDRIVRPSTLSAFLEALNGNCGALDEWLECNNESEVRAHIFALMKTEREEIITLAAKQGWAMKNEDPFEDAVRDICAMRYNPVITKSE